MSISKLRSLNVEDNFNNTFRKKVLLIDYAIKIGTNVRKAFLSAKQMAGFYFIQRPLFIASLDVRVPEQE